MSYVYFISFEGGPIKIGKATDVKKRLSGLQTSHPETLNVLGVMHGSTDLEWKLHKEFAVYRLRGEWFQRSDAILDFILKNRDESLWDDPSPLLKYDEVDAEKTRFGCVQVIDCDDEMYGKYGYWDDDEIEVEECDFCREASKRKIEIPHDYECTKCITKKYAIVYYGSWSEGWAYIDHYCLRRLDEVRERAKCLSIVKGLFPNFDDSDASLVIEQDDVMAPAHAREFWRRDVVKVLETHYSGAVNG